MAAGVVDFLIGWREGEGGGAVNLVMDWREGGGAIDFVVDWREGGGAIDFVIVFVMDFVIDLLDMRPDLPPGLDVPDGASPELTPQGSDVDMKGYPTPDFHVGLESGAKRPICIHRSISFRSPKCN